MVLFSFAQLEHSKLPPNLRFFSLPHETRLLINDDHFLFSSIYLAKEKIIRTHRKSILLDHFGAILMNEALNVIGTRLLYLMYQEL